MRQFAHALILSLWIILMIPPLPSLSGETGKIKWLSYSDAQKQKVSDRRKIFIYFYAEWCTYCAKLENSTFADAKVAEYINANYTAVIIDSDKEKKLAARFGVQGLPDIRFLDPDGKSIARWPGYIESERLLNLLRFIHTDSYETMSFREFVKQQEK